MAASGFGVSGVRMKSLDCGSASRTLAALRPSLGLRIPETIRFDQFVVSRRSAKPVIALQSSVSKADLNAKVDDHLKDTHSCVAVKTDIPNAAEIESLLTMLCDTSIAELDLKIGGFQLYVSRNLVDHSAPPQPPVPAPVAIQPVSGIHDSNGSVESTSLTLSKPNLYSNGADTLFEQAAELGLTVLKSPRVGFFRRSRTIKGKKTPPACKEKDIVKESQVLCYIDQLGGEIPVESDISGEVVKILRADGEPVGYGDALIAVLPSFPGIKNIQ
ncbi:uncharacterized protein LOC127254946 isoform X2 [Andrographis paniculata]|uniref:uncharacterized protein LOC127254946 isoform X2 n=1 Tax=Andrographis paniculata TaxID=175694 RepID=UPI0021E937BB|nr:uncharacterized protein LOC127254946 isoform X2 [Andrographis paniculata]